MVIFRLHRYRFITLDLEVTARHIKATNCKWLLKKKLVLDLNKSNIFSYILRNFFYCMKSLSNMFNIDMEKL